MCSGRKLYCKRRGIVLQEKRNCIAIGRLVVEPLYCNTRIVLQLGCIVAEFVLQEEVVEDCIAIQLLYCNLGE